MTTIVETEDGTQNIVLPTLSGHPHVLANPVDTYLAGKSFNTQRMARSHMNKVAQLFDYSNYACTPWGCLRYHHVQELVGVLNAKKYAPKTINAILSTVRGVATAAFNMYQMEGDDLERIRGVKMVRGSRLKSGRVVPQGELMNLVQVCLDSEGPAGIRDIAIIGTLYICGLRRSEVVALRINDVDFKNNAIKLIGKGNKERKVFLDSGTEAALKDWITVRGEQEGALFFRIDKAGRLIDGQLSDQAIYCITQKRWKQAGVPPMTPHDFRKTFISTLLAKGVDLLTVQRMAGHSDPRTTGGYDLRPEEDMKAAVTLLHLPYTHMKK